mgnify:CR=1 FL=1
MLLVDSSALYPLAYLFSERNEFEMRWIGFLNACGHKRMKAMKPPIFTNAKAKIYINHFGRAFFKKFHHLIYRVSGQDFTVTSKNLNDIMTSTIAMYHSGFEHVSRLTTSC